MRNDVLNLYKTEYNPFFYDGSCKINLVINKKYKCIKLNIAKTIQEEGAHGENFMATDVLSMTATFSGSTMRTAVDCNNYYDAQEYSDGMKNFLLKRINTGIHTNFEYRTENVTIQEVIEYDNILHSDHGIYNGGYALDKSELEIFKSIIGNF